MVIDGTIIITTKIVVMTTTIGSAVIPKIDEITPIETDTATIDATTTTKGIAIAMIDATTTTVKIATATTTTDTRIEVTTAIVTTEEATIEIPIMMIDDRKKAGEKRRPIFNYGRSVVTARAKKQC